MLAELSLAAMLFAQSRDLPPGDAGTSAVGEARSRDEIVLQVASGTIGEVEAPGIVMVLLLPATRREEAQPADGPFFARPHPFASASIGLSDGQVVRLGGAVEDSIEPRWHPAPLEDLDGTFRVQAVFRPARVDPTPGAAPEIRSEVVLVDLDPQREDRIDLELLPEPERIMPPRRMTMDAAPPTWTAVEEPSVLLRDAASSDPVHRAWVVFPAGYHDLAAPRRVFPTIYVIPDQGDGVAEAASIRDAIALEETLATMPQAVWVVLDPSSRWGHHGFADSPVHGPRATALVEEFIPSLERRFRLLPSGDARLLMGHGAGGWTALWLQNEFPREFAGAFATSPETVDLSRLGFVDAYGVDAFVDQEGSPLPAFREPVAAGEAVRTMIDVESAMARTADPLGRSGDRWDRWTARMSPLDSTTGAPRRLFDEEGRIDRDLSEQWWLRQDLAAAVAREPRRRIPLWDEKIHVWVGSRDEFFNDRACLSLRSLLADLRRGLMISKEGRGGIRLVPGATFETVVPKSRVEMYDAMIRTLRGRGVHD